MSSHFVAAAARGLDGAGARTICVIVGVVSPGTAGHAAGVGTEQRIEHSDVLVARHRAHDLPAVTA